jgi:hypothetical protein
MDEMDDIEDIEDIEAIEVIEYFSFCGEITSRVSQVCILVMTKQSHCEHTTC